MQKIVFFEETETKEILPVKVNCKREDNLEQIEEKANIVLMHTLVDDCDIINYEIKEIKDLID